MKVKRYCISINNPCHEDWASMSTTEQGKFCSSCAKNVIDFTKLTDAEIIHIVQKNKGNICGRAKINQLNRVLTPPEPKPFFRPFYKALAGALVLAGSDTVNGHNSYKQEVISEVINTNTINHDDETIPEENVHRVIKGKVMHSKTGEPFYLCVILLKNTQLFTHSDLNGNFEMTIPDTIIKDTLKFEARLFGYRTVEFSVIKTAFINPVDIFMQKDEIKEPLVISEMKGQIVVITGGICTTEEDENIAPPEMLFNYLFH